MSEEPVEESFFDFSCPYCGGLNSFPTGAVHTVQECASCIESLIVPAAGAETGGKLPVPITTARMLLRRFHRDDSVDLLKLVAQDESCDLPVTETTVDQWIEEQRVARFTRSQSGVCLAVELTEGHVLAGYVSIFYTAIDRQGAGFNITITPSRRRQGLALEAARAVIDFCFDGLCARRVSVSCPGQTAASCGLVEKTGMRKEGEFIKSWFDGKDWVNVSWYAMLAEERQRL